MLPQDTDSALHLRRQLSHFIGREAFGKDILDLLLPNGEPHLFEKSMWDYKSELPVKSLGTNDKDHSAKMAEVVKDVVSFYNSFGGYLVVGICDNPRSTIGFDRHFDCGELSKKIKGATGVEIDCHFAIHCTHYNGIDYKLGLLQIPQRPDGKEAVQFRNNAPVSNTGKRAYKRDDIYLRLGDQSRPATSSEDFSFLCSEGRRRIIEGPQPPLNVVDHNLGPRDPSFVKFVGRTRYLEMLWKWFCDCYGSVKLVAGLGGLGKTTIAREFSEDVIRAAPMGLQKVIWLSAKQQFYAAVLGKYLPTSRVDFADIPSLLRAILVELGNPEDTIPTDASRELLIDECIASLKLLPALVIVDDIDSLNPDDQSDVFQTLVLIMNRSVSGSGISSRALLTARLDLGAAPGQLIRLTGLDYSEFSEFVKITADSLGIPFDYQRKQIESFHKDSGGSPTFASSILRLLQTGENLSTSLKRWQGSDGEDVRRFAFKKELDSLTDTQIRTLYALCVLGESSHAELQHILQTPDGRLRDDLGELRKFHLLSLASDAGFGGSRLQIPSTIRLMRDLIRKRIADPSRIEQECARARAGTPRMGLDVGPLVSRVVELWRGGSNDEALQAARYAQSKHPSNGDLACLVGRAYLKHSPIDYRLAEASFRKANELGCRRPELFSLWCETKQKLSDWEGLVQLTRKIDDGGENADLVCLRASCYISLAESAQASGNMSRAIEYYRDGAHDVDKILRKRVIRIRATDLIDFRYRLMTGYVRLTDRIALGSRDHLAVWLAVTDAFDCYVQSASLVKLGLQRLQSWWEGVRSAEYFHEKAAELMRKQLGTLELILERVRGYDIPDASLLAMLLQVKNQLTESWKAYRLLDERPGGARFDPER